MNLYANLIGNIKIFSHDGIYLQIYCTLDINISQNRNNHLNLEGNLK